jgi:hypothetical protein
MDRDATLPARPDRPDRPERPRHLDQPPHLDRPDRPDRLDRPRHLDRPDRLRRPGLTDPRTLLAAWEEAAALPALARGAALVYRCGLHADPAGGLDAALDLPLGEAARLAVRESVETFGARVEATLKCPACGDALELELSLGELAATSAGTQAAGVVAAVTEVGGTRAGSTEDDPGQDGGWRPVPGAGLLARSPTTRDLLAVAGLPDVEAGLVERCVRTADGGAVQVGALTPAELEAVDADLERRNGSAAVVVRTGCPGCGGQVSEALDAGTLLWQQVQAAAPVLLAEVAALATAFGWSEDAVLGLSQFRRRAYLALLDAM